jgi:hypothetical protein
MSVLGAIFVCLGGDLRSASRGIGGSGQSQFGSIAIPGVNVAVRCDWSALPDRMSDPRLPSRLAGRNLSYVETINEAPAWKLTSCFFTENQNQCLPKVNRL